MGTHPTAQQQDEIENLDHLTEDNREICFEQGKPCIYEDEDRPGQIITEWPNGVTDTADIRTDTTIRVWPDGSEETLGNEPEFPHWPRRAQTRKCRS